MHKDIQLQIDAAHTLVDWLICEEIELKPFEQREQAQRRCDFFKKLNVSDNKRFIDQVRGTI